MNLKKVRYLLLGVPIFAVMVFFYWNEFSQGIKNTMPFIGSMFVIVIFLFALIGFVANVMVDIEAPWIGGTK